MSGSAEAVAKKLNAKPAGGGYLGTCPCPGHKTPENTLSIATGDTQAVVVNCLSGRHTSREVLDELRRSGMLDSPTPAAPRRPDPERPDFRPTVPGAEREAVYAYRDAQGNLLQYVVRWRLPDGTKSFCPYCRDGAKWVKRQLLDPRPLYGLDLLAQRHAAPVLVVEGEKAAEAARAALGEDWAVVTWSGGTNAVQKADWAPLEGRTVTIWPDNDEPGRKAAAWIVERLPGAVGLDVSDLPPKADAADVTPEEVCRRVEAGKSDGQADTEPEWEEASIVDLMDKPFTPMQWVVPGMLAGGRLAHIAGEEKSGKTTLLLQAAVALQKGGTFLGRPVPCGRTLYLDFDWNGQQEFIRFCRELGADRTDLITYINPQNAKTGNPIIMDVRGVESLRRSIRKHGDVKLVVIDNMVNALTSREDRRGYNAQETDARQLRALAQVAKEFPDVAFVIIGHTTKAGGKDPFSRYAGSRAIGGNVDIQLVLEGTGGGTKATLSGRGRGGLARYSEKLRRAGRRAGWELADPAEDLPALQQAVFTTLRNADAPMKLMDLVRALGRDASERGNVQVALQSLEKAGRVERDSDKQWSLAGPDDDPTL